MRVRNHLGAIVERPGQNDMVPTKFVLQYLGGTRVNTLVIGPGNDLQLNVYVDANWVGDGVLKQRIGTERFVQYGKAPIYLVRTVQMSVFVSLT